MRQRRGPYKAAGTIARRDTEAAPDQGIPSSRFCAVRRRGASGMAEGWFIVGEIRPFGVAAIRTGKGWSAPAFFVVGGGSFGLQIGGRRSDPWSRLLIMVATE